MEERAGRLATEQRSAEQQLDGQQSAEQQFDEALALVAQHRSMSIGDTALVGRIQADFEATVIEAARVRAGRTKGVNFERSAVILDGALAVLRKPFEARVEEIHVERTSQRRGFEFRLRELALVTPIGTPRTLWLVLERPYDAWRSAGSQYARVFCELRGLEAADHGVEYRVEQIDGTWQCSVLVSHERDVEILKRLPGSSTVETVRRCWKLSANPRVFFPFLPHGFEERQGLDFFGGYKGEVRMQRGAL